MLSRASLPPSYRLTLKNTLRLVVFLFGMTCLCLAAIQAFTLDQMPHTADGELQLYRSAALEHSLRVDHPLWPRYSSGLVYGYGAPLFNFFPPLAYYPTSLAHSLGLSFVDSWLSTMCLYTVMAGAGMYLLGRLWTRSEMGGWMAAAAYVYAPYFLFDSLARGATAELAALAALPFALYGMTRLAFFGRRRDFAIAVFAFALFMPLHTLITLHGTALLALYCLFLTWRATDKRPVFFRLLLAGVLGLLLTAFYWLPALAENDAIKLPLIAEQLGHIDVQRHLRPLSEVIALPQIADPTQQNQNLPISVGWVQLVLAGIGTLLSWRAPHRRYRSLMLTLWAAVAFLIFLNTPSSAWLWENIPLIGYTQFPWRTLGLASLLLALMTAVGARLIWQSLGGGRRGVALVVGTTLLLILYALPRTYTLYHDDVALDDIRDLQQFERESGQLALSSYAEYLPVSADARHLDPQRLMDRFATDDVIPRLLPSDTVEILEQEWRGTSAKLRLDSVGAQTLVFDWLFVPGWAATIDGRPAAVFPSMPAGLVALEVPAGEFDLKVALEPTAIQSTAVVLSAFGLLTAIVFFWIWRRRSRGADDGQSDFEHDKPWALIVITVGLCAFLLKTLVLDATDTPFKRARFGPTAQAVANFGDAIDLLQVDLPDEEINTHLLKVKLYWRIHDAPLDRDYSSILRMRDPQGLVIAEAGSFTPGGLASSNWLPGAYIEDVIEFEVPRFTPALAERYTFDVALYDAESLAALSVMNAAGNPEDVKFDIASLRLRLSETEFEEGNMLPLQAPSDRATAALIEAPNLPAAATVGDELQINWAWQKLRESASSMSAAILWLDESASEIARSTAFHLVNRYDFADWRVGEVNRGHHLLVVPPNLPAGSYALGIRPLDVVGGSSGDVIRLDGEISLAVPQREFVAPSFAVESGAEWENGLLLHGFSLGSNGDIELVWGTKAILSESLRLFLHALDTEDKIVAQWDGVPVDWMRPTTGWIPGEYIKTAHAFSLPAGEYRLRLGWYMAASGERVAVGEADALLLEQTLVVE